MRPVAVTILTLAAAACDDPEPRNTRFGTPVRIGEDINQSFDPRLAVSANGQANVLWLALDTGEHSAWSNRYVPDGGWGVPGVIEQAAGAAQWPELVADDGGNALAAWTSSIGATTTVLSNRLLAGSGWGVAEPLFDASSRPRLAMNRLGFATLLWTTPLSPRRVHAARFDPASGWSTPETIDLPNLSPSAMPLVAMDDVGNAIAVWGDNATSQGMSETVWANRYGVGSGWGTPIMLAANEDGVAVTSLAMNRAGDAVAMTREMRLRGPAVAAAYFDRAGGWQVYTLLDTETQADVPTAVVDEDGNVIAAWRVQGGLPNDVFAAYRPRGGGWAAPELIGTAQDPEGLGEPPPVSLAVAADGSAFAAWRQKNGAWVNSFTPGVGWGVESTLRAADTSLPQLGVDDAGTTMAVWVEDGDVFAATAAPLASASGEGGR